MGAPHPADFRQHLEVETPEHVVLDYEIAGVGSRALAGIADAAVIGVWLIALGYILGEVLGDGRAMAIAWGLTGFATFWGYYAFFEGLREGQTPGKRWVGIRVVMDTGHPVTFGAAAARNLLRIADFLPPPYLLGTLFVALHPRGKRLGDIVGGTVVVRDRPMEAAADAGTAAAPAAETAGVPELSDEEFRFIREFAERAPALPAAVRAGLAGRLAERLAGRFPAGAEDPEALLAAVYRDELARRRGRFGARAAPGERRLHAGSAVAERLVARKNGRWDQFQAMADRAAREGLDSFAAQELPEFAARYREVAADLARARTYQATPAVQARLERLVAAGHNTLYRDQRRTTRRLWQFVLRECPAGIIEARRAVLLAFLVFILPALGGFLLLRERPALALEVLPQTMLERAEAGHQRLSQGHGYFEAESGERPFMASAIMTNNITVAFYCFAGGVFAGVGSLVLLAFNGLSVGAISGHFTNMGLFGYLWTFIIGHGVLELFAIWVAGAAGFLLGHAIIAPGDLRRGDALLLAGRLAMRMIGAVILLLVIAGLIEGLVSASPAPLALRLAVSTGSLLFLIAYLLNGWRFYREGKERSVPAPAATGPVR